MPAVRGGNHRPLAAALLLGNVRGRGARAVPAVHGDAERWPVPGPRAQGTPAGSHKPARLRAPPRHHPWMPAVIADSAVRAPPSLRHVDRCRATSRWRAASRRWTRQRMRPRQAHRAGGAALSASSTMSVTRLSRSNSMVVSCQVGEIQWTIRARALSISRDLGIFQQDGKRGGRGRHRRAPRGFYLMRLQL